MERKQFSILAVAITSASALILWFNLLNNTSHHLSENGLAAPLNAPAVMGVDPTSAPNDLDTSIVISGTGFSAVLSGTVVITPPKAYFDSTPLQYLVWVNSTTLSATVPWGLNMGGYTLTVVNPDGISGTLTNAFTVTQGIGVWQPGELYGGTVQRVTVNQDRPTTIYATASEVGFFRSDDGGDSWQFKFVGPGTINMMISPAWPDRIYMGRFHIATLR